MIAGRVKADAPVGRIQSTMGAPTPTLWLWLTGLCVAALLTGVPALPLPPPTPLDAPPLTEDDLKLDVLADLSEIPTEERGDEAVSPELVELYRDVDLLFEMQKSNLTDSREGRSFLSKLSFLTGLKLGSFLSTSGTLAASQSVNFLGKVLNAALSISYGNVGGYGGGLYGGGTVEPVVGGEPIVGLQKLPIIQEDVPQDDKKREKPGGISGPPAVDAPTSLSDAARKEFIKTHNQRVQNLNSSFGKKVKSRTGRIEIQRVNKDT